MLKSKWLLLKLWCEWRFEVFMSAGTCCVLTCALGQSLALQRGEITQIMIGNATLQLVTAECWPVVTAQQIYVFMLSFLSKIKLLFPINFYK